MGPPREPTDSEKQDAKEGGGDFYGSGCRDWAETMTGGEGMRMAAEALDLVAVKEAAKMVKQSGAQSKGKKSKGEEDSDVDDDDEMLTPFELGSICWMGAGKNRRQVKIQAIEKMKPLKYKVQLGETTRYPLHTQLEFLLTPAQHEDAMRLKRRRDRKWKKLIARLPKRGVSGRSRRKRERRQSASARSNASRRSASERSASERSASERSAIERRASVSRRKREKRMSRRMRMGQRRKSSARKAQSTRAGSMRSVHAARAAAAGSVRNVRSVPVRAARAAAAAAAASAPLGRCESGSLILRPWRRCGRRACAWKLSGMIARGMRRSTRRSATSNVVIHCVAILCWFGLYTFVIV